jgi:hypothetical protein
MHRYNISFKFHHGIIIIGIIEFGNKTKAPSRGGDVLAKKKKDASWSEKQMKEIEMNPPIKLVSLSSKIRLKHTERSNNNIKH